MARHSARELVLVENDPRLPGLLRQWYGEPLAAVLDSAEVHVLARDPLRALGGSKRWDLIVLRDGNPTTIRRDRTRTVHFFERCRASLARDGAVVVGIGVSDTYLGGGAGRLVEVMASTLGKVFPRVVAIPGESILLVAGGESADLSVSPSVLRARWTDRQIEDPAFAPEMLELLVDPSRAADLQAFVDAARAPANTILRPRAVLLSAGLDEARARASLLVVFRTLEASSPMALAFAMLALVLAVAAGSFARRTAAVTAAAVVGCCSMGWWLLLLAAWQATLGSVYAEVGALTAAFMAGTAVGSAAASRRAGLARRLPLVLLAGAALSVALALGAAFVLPAVVVPLLLVLGGVLTGAAFGGAAELAGRGQTRRGAGLAFAADEAGAAAAAIGVGIVALPWAGMTWTAAGLALLGVAVIPGLVLTLARR